MYIVICREGFVQAMIHQINSADQIVFVDAEWMEFGRNNQLNLEPSKIIGTGFYKHIVGTETKELYYHVLKKVRDTKVKIEFPFRCDAPDRRRFLMMYVLPLPKAGIEFMSLVLKEEPRDPVALLTLVCAHSEKWLKICSLCRNVEVSHGKWVEVEEAIRTLGLFGSDALPRLRHYTCHQCKELLS